jgi:hypothetical protein
LIFNLPEQAAMLMKQAFEALSNASSILSMHKVDGSTKGKAAVVIEAMENLSKPSATDGAESSRQGATLNDGSGKAPYCFRCKTKGHTIEECHVNMFCDICETSDHI